ncbi:MAG: hypothetical protein K6E93_02455 [Bacteroidales bacterium]|nr:hypothetical protein [Bacteroidales bacterium]
MLCLLAVSMIVLYACTKGRGGKGEEVAGKYVDLGLSSGTKWMTVDEENTAVVEYDFFTYEEAIAAYGDKLPSRKQWMELVNECSWSWAGMGYKVVGPNGKSILLPAAGYRGCDGSVHCVGSSGDYWSSTPNGSDDAWNFFFGSDGGGLRNTYRCYGYSVRLVQD